MQTFEHLLFLPHDEKEQQYLRNILETLSPREGYALTAFLTRQDIPLTNTAQAINTVLDLHNYHVYHKAEEQRQTEIKSRTNGGTRISDSEDIAVGEYFVAFPAAPPAEIYTGVIDFFYEPVCEIRAKLVSDACPKGVWVPIPDCSCRLGDTSEEASIALRELKADAMQECRVAEAVVRTSHRCNIPLLPTALDVLRGSDNPQSLIYDLSRFHSEDFWDEVVFTYPNVCRHLHGEKEIDLDEYLGVIKIDEFNGLDAYFVQSELCQAVDWKKYAVRMLVDQEGYTWDTERKMFHRPDGPISEKHLFTENVPKIRDAVQSGATKFSSRGCVSCANLAKTHREMGKTDEKLNKRETDRVSLKTGRREKKHHKKSQSGTDNMMKIVCGFRASP